MDTDEFHSSSIWLKPYLYCCLAFLIAVTAGCQLPQPPAPAPPEGVTTTITPSSVPEREATPTLFIELTPQEIAAPATPIEQPTQSHTPLPQAGRLPTQYRLVARYDHARHALAVNQSIHYTNDTLASLPDLVLLVEANRYPGVFQLDRLSWGTGEAVQDYSLEANRLVIPLPQPISPGGQLALEIAYNLALPPIPEDSDEYKPVPFGYTSRQVNLVDWFPFLPPYRAGAGWLAHDPWFFGEHQVYAVADYEVEIEVSGSAEPLVLAASSLPASQGGNTYRYTLAGARTFAISLSPYYQVYTRQVGTTTVQSYGLPYFEEGAQAALQYTAEALEIYNELFGAYPRPSLSVVVADFLDGMEYDGLYFLSRGFYNLYDGTPAGYLTIIAVHETAHQWWYGRVGNDQALEPWLDEALCTYSERLYYEFSRPELADWWWAYRVGYYKPAGRVNGSVYDYSGFRPYRDAVYLRGAQFLEALRQQVGDEAFFAFLKDYPARMAGKQATSEDFFSILAEHSPADIANLQQEFFLP